MQANQAKLIETGVRKLDLWELFLHRCTSELCLIDTKLVMDVFFCLQLPSDVFIYIQEAVSNSRRREKKTQNLHTSGRIL